MSKSRLVWELKEIEEAEDELNFTRIELIDETLLTWEGLLNLNFAPYDKGAFKLRIEFPSIKFQLFIFSKKL